MSAFILFVFGAAIGSFINVLALRYRGDHFLFSPKVIGGRSHCPHCKKTLRWFELVPILSFLLQGGKCRNCKHVLGLHYPLVELLSGLIFVFIPRELGGLGTLPILWIAAFELLLLLTYVDIRLQIVPDELVAVLSLITIFITIYTVGDLGIANHSFFGPNVTFFGLQDNVWINRVAGIAFGAGFFAFLIFITRGKGMGWGDVKLGVPLGLLFGWPDIIFLYGAAFVIGALVGGLFLVRKAKTMESPLPFVPFLAFGAVFVFFFGAPMFEWYIHTIGL